jgi:hypothetical protein
MNFDATIKALGICIQTKVPALLEGGVGEGKTAIIQALFSAFCDDYQVSIVALHEPPEYGGYPVPQAAVHDAEGRITQPAGVGMLPVGWVARLARAKRPGLFLDEFSNGAPATRSATMRGVLDGVWGETRIPNLATVVAMNPADIAESGYELSAPLSNRFCHLGWDMPVEWWNQQHIAGFPAPDAGEPLPADWEKHLLWARTLVAAFANAKPDAIRKMPAEAALRSKPFPSMRSWTQAERLLAACRALGYGVGDTKGALPHDVLVKCLEGCTGPGAGREFLTYVGELDLPDPEAVLADPASLKLPERGDRAFAVLTAVVGAVLANNTPKRWNAAWAVLAKATAQGRPDVAASSARLLAQHRPADTRLPKEVSAFVPLLKVAGLI